MKKNLLFIVLFLTFCIRCSPEKSDRSYPTQRMVINNRHTITQIVTESPPKEHNTPSGILPSFNQQATPVFDNQHIISQKSTRTLSSSKEFSYAIPSPHQKNSAYCSYLALLIPPIMLKMSWLHYAAAAMGISYSVILAKLLCYEHAIISTKNRWALWNTAISIETMDLQKKQYTQELCTAIQLRYHNAPSLAYFLSPLVYFINDVNKELEQAHTFIALHAILIRCKIHFLFPEQSSTLQQAHDTIARLEYLKIMIVNGIGEYKVECTNS